MKLKIVAILLALVSLSLGEAAYSQSVPVTVTRNDSIIRNTKPTASGGSIPCVAGYGSCQIMKNLVYPGNFEGLHNQNTWTLQGNGTGTSVGSTVTFTTEVFNIPVGGTALLQARWTGAKATFIEYANGAANCTDTVSSITINGPDNSQSSMTVNFVPNTVTTVNGVSSTTTGACPNLVGGDVAVLTRDEIPTTGTAAGNTYQGGGGAFTLNSTTPLDGQVSLEMNTLTAGSFAYYSLYFDTDSSDRFVSLDGTYQVSMKLKLISGPGTLAVDVSTRSGYCQFSGGNFGSFTATTTTQTYTATCVANENTTLPNPGTPAVVISTSSQSDILIDDISFQKISNQDATNTTIFRDEFVNGLRKQFYSGHSGPLRLGPLIQNGETYANWIKPYQTAMGVNATPTGNAMGVPQLPDYLALAKLVNAYPYWHLPCAATSADAVSEYNYSMTYGFAQQFISECNEAWNGQSMGQNMAYWTGEPTYWTTYVHHVGTIFAAIHASSSYVASKTQLIINAQFQANANFMLEVAKLGARGGAPDGPEISPYYPVPFTSSATGESMFRAAFSEPWIQINNSSSLLASVIANFRSQSIWGPLGTAQPTIHVYEESDGDNNACSATASASNTIPVCQPSATAINDAHNLQEMNQGAGNALVAAFEFFENQGAGMYAQNVFALNSYGGSSLTASPAGGFFYNYLYGGFADCGGAMSVLDGLPCRVRANIMGLQVANLAVLNTMTSCPNNAPTYTQTALTGLANYYPTTSGVPYLASYCYMDGAGNFSIALVNLSTTTTYNVTVAGTNAPSGAMSGLLFAPPSLLSLNEAAATATGNAPTNTTAATMGTSSVTFASPSVYSVAPGTIVTVVYGTAAVSVHNYIFGPSVTRGPSWIY